MKSREHRELCCSCDEKTVELNYKSYILSSYFTHHWCTWSKLRNLSVTDQTNRAIIAMHLNFPFYQSVTMHEITLWKKPNKSIHHKYTPTEREKVSTKGGAAEPLIRR